MYYHKDDFGISAEWNFFAKSYEMGPCDGVGGVVRCLATRYSKTLAKSGKDLLLTAGQLYEFANENTLGVKVFWCVQKMKMNSLTSTSLYAPKVHGRHDHHWVKPLSSTFSKSL